jgi:hypothetical protein
MPAAAAWSVRRRWPPVSPHRAFEAAVPFQAKSTGREKEGKRNAIQAFRKISHLF